MDQQMIGLVGRSIAREREQNLARRARQREADPARETRPRAHALSGRRAAGTSVALHV